VKPNPRRFNFMAKKSITISGAAMAVLAIIAGIIVLFWFDAVRWVLGIFLIVWGVLALINK
jgi:uncharacterized membrane protein HdeD (DUF308 family)